MLSLKTLEVMVLGLGLCALACERDPEESNPGEAKFTEGSSGDGDDHGENADEVGDGDGDGDGDGHGDGDGDGEGEGDGDGESDGGDGDGESDEGDGDGENDSDAPDLCADSCGTPGCGECPEAADADALWFLIDSTEVTVGDYASFAALEFDPAFLSPACTWKQDLVGFEPNDWQLQLAGNLNHPVHGVDWCDAESYCRWAGKRLCGLVGGGPAQLDQLVDPANEWHRACTAGGLLLYPYGNNYKPFACNGDGLNLGGVVPVGSLLECQGGVNELWDMSGNLWEWTNACGEQPGIEDWEQECQRRGGSFHSSDKLMRCAVDSRRHRGYRDDATGFRCCSG